MKIVWFKWKDIRHPTAGGAEIVSHELMRRLVSAGHEVTLVTAMYPGAGARDAIDGIRILRVGNRVTHYFHAARLFARQLRGHADLAIEEVNTVPYFLSLLSRAPRVVLLYHQLARQIWFYELPLPLSAIGYAAEPLYTWLQARSQTEVVTVSEDSKADLVRFGFHPTRIHIITEAIQHRPLEAVDPMRKEQRFTILFHSSLRPMKRPVAVLTAFKLLADQVPDCQLWISGAGDQRSLRAFCGRHGLADRVTFFGRTSEEMKLDLMKRATVLCATSVKEGWGLIVTEANSMGTPAVVYDVDGLRSASTAGGNWTVSPDPAALAKGVRSVHEMFTQHRDDYDAWCRRVLTASRQFSFDRCYRDFAAVIIPSNAEQRRAS